MGREGFPHGILSALEFLSDCAVAHQLSVQAQIPEQVKHLGDREVPIRLSASAATPYGSILRSLSRDSAHRLAGVSRCSSG